jgi:hypothetical protein
VGQTADRVRVAVLAHADLPAAVVAADVMSQTVENGVDRVFSGGKIWISDPYLGRGTADVQQRDEAKVQKWLGIPQLRARWIQLGIQFFQIVERDASVPQVNRDLPATVRLTGVLSGDEVVHQLSPLCSPRCRDASTNQEETGTPGDTALTEKYSV